VNGFKSIELCAGAGGQALGLERAGFRHSLLVENDPDACATLRLNRREWRVFETDVRSLRVAERFDCRNVDLLAAGVPCPPFSIAGQQLGADDERDLFPALLRLVGEIRPSAVMVENVKGLLQARFAGYRGQILQQLKELGYVPVMWEVLYAADYGVPQLRPRSVLVALLPQFADAWVPPQPSGARVTVAEALAESMHGRGLHHAELAAWATKAWAVAPTLVGGSKKHGGPDLGPTRARARWAELGVDGGSVADDKEPATLDGPKGLGPRLTVEQCAIIQGFPPEWQFAGKKTARYRQVGNAFPPPVAQAVAERIAAALRRPR
jgi:DNA (cytosine-5)-methyltransferase 1